MKACNSFKREGWFDLSWVLYWH